MNVFDAADDLLVHLGSLVLFEPPVLHDVLEELAARAILHDEVQVIVVLYHFVQLDYLRVTHLLQDGDFTIDPLNIRMVLDLVLLENLDGDFVAGDYMRALLHFTEGTLSFSLANDEAAYNFALTVLFFLRVLRRLCASSITSLICAVLLCVVLRLVRGRFISRRFRALLLFL